MAYSIKFPIDINTDGDLELTQDIISNSKQNLKMLILTDPGERLMIPEYGVGLKRFLFENINDKNILENKKDIVNLENRLKSIITKQLSKYEKNISLVDLNLVINELNSIYIKIYYSTSGIIAEPLEITF